MVKGYLDGHTRECAWIEGYLPSMERLKAHQERHGRLNPRSEVPLRRRFFGELDVFLEERVKPLQSYARSKDDEEALDMHVYMARPMSAVNITKGIIDPREGLVLSEVGRNYGIVMAVMRHELGEYCRHVFWDAVESMGFQNREVNDPTAERRIADYLGTVSQKVIDQYIAPIEAVHDALENLSLYHR